MRDEVAEGDGERVGVGEGVRLDEADGVDVHVGEGDGEGVRDGDTVGDGVEVAVLEGFGERLGVGEMVGVADRVGDGERVGVLLGLGERLGVGLGEEVWEGLGLGVAVGVNQGGAASRVEAKQLKKSEIKKLRHRFVLAGIQDAVVENLGMNSRSVCRCGKIFVAKIFIRSPRHFEKFIILRSTQPPSVWLQCLHISCAPATLRFTAFWTCRGPVDDCNIDRIILHCSTSSGPIFGPAIELPPPVFHRHPRGLSGFS